VSSTVTWTYKRKPVAPPPVTSVTLAAAVPAGASTGVIGSWVYADDGKGTVSYTADWTVNGSLTTLKNLTVTSKGFSFATPAAGDTTSYQLCITTVRRNLTAAAVCQSGRYGSAVIAPPPPGPITVDSSGALSAVTIWPQLLQVTDAATGQFCAVFQSAAAQYYLHASQRALPRCQQVIQQWGAGSSPQVQAHLDSMTLAWRSNGYGTITPNGQYQLSSDSAGLITAGTDLDVAPSVNLTLTPALPSLAPTAPDFYAQRVGKENGTLQRAAP
jgi:hypothetical protein